MRIPMKGKLALLTTMTESKRLTPKQVRRMHFELSEFKFDCQEKRLAGKRKGDALQEVFNICDMILGTNGIKYFTGFNGPQGKWNPPVIYIDFGNRDRRTLFYTRGTIQCEIMSEVKNLKSYPDYGKSLTVTMSSFTNDMESLLDDQNGQHSMKCMESSHQD